MPDCMPTVVGSVGASRATQLVQECALANTGDSREERTLRGQRFLAEITANLAVDIVAHMDGWCPDLTSLARCIAGLVPSAQEGDFPPGPSAASPFLSPPRDGERAIALLVPYRARPTELRKWLFWTLPLLLQPGAPAFGIFVVEEINGPLWNKARLLNAGIREVRKLSVAFDCFIFADVDLVMQVRGPHLDMYASSSPCPTTPPLLRFARCVARVVCCHDCASVPPLTHAHAWRTGPARRHCGAGCGVQVR